MWTCVRMTIVVMAAWTFAGTPLLRAQMHNPPGQMHGQAMQTAGMQGHMTSADQMMEHAGAMMNNAGAIMRQMAAERGSMHGDEHWGQHADMMKSLDTMLAHMRDVHGHLQQRLHDPELMQHRGAQDQMRDACRDLERMAGAFEQMTKHMSRALEGAPHGRK